MKAPSQYDMTGGIEKQNNWEHRRCEIEEAFTVFYDWRHLKRRKEKSTEYTVGVITIFRREFSKAKRAA